MIHYVSGFVGRSNVERFPVYKDGELFNLELAGVVKIEASATYYVTNSVGEHKPITASIDSEIGGVHFEGSDIFIQMGLLEVPYGVSCAVNVIAYTIDNCDGEVIFSDDHRNAIILTMRGLAGVT